MMAAAVRGKVIWLLSSGRSLHSTYEKWDIGYRIKIFNVGSVTVTGQWNRLEASWSISTE